MSRGFWIGVASCLGLLGGCAVGVRSSTDDTDGKSPPAPVDYEEGSPCDRLQDGVADVIESAKEAGEIPEDSVPCGPNGIESGVGIFTRELRSLMQCENLRLCSEAPNAECGNTRLELSNALRLARNGIVKQDATACGGENSAEMLPIPSDDRITASILATFKDLCPQERRVCAED